MERNEEPIQSAAENPLQPVFDLLQGGDPAAICSKYGISRDELDKRLQTYQTSRRQAALADHLVLPKVGRNEPCPCGSGKKFKKCCLPGLEEARRNTPPDQLQQMEERAKRKERLEEEVKKGFDLLFEQDFDRARQLIGRLLESYPEDDRLHDIKVIAALATGDYDGAFHVCRRRWQVAREERTFYQENGYHKREGVDGKQLVYFYTPSTWLEKFWIAQRARAYASEFPLQVDSDLAKTVEKLKLANDVKRFPGRQEEGYEMRRKALAPVLSQVEAEGVVAIPHLLPLTYSFSWASLFVPDLLRAFGTETSIRLLAELSMFRFPYFAQKCLLHLEQLGERVMPHIDQVLQENPAFDELKVGLVAVLGNVRTPQSFNTLVRLTQHENPYVVNWAAQALGKHRNPEALPHLEKARERLGALSKIAGAIRELAEQQKA